MKVKTTVKAGALATLTNVSDVRNVTMRPGRGFAHGVIVGR